MTLGPLLREKSSKSSGLVVYAGTNNLGSTDVYMYGTESKDGSQVAMKRGDTYTIDEFTKRVKQTQPLPCDWKILFMGQT